MKESSRQVIILVREYVQATAGKAHRAGGTITLITGDPMVIIDTGAPEQQQEILDALSANGVESSDIKYVVNTHGHLDHIGNNNLFPHATFVLDTDLAKDGEYWSHDFQVGPLDIASNDGSPPVVVMLTPGHTDHDLSVLVETSDGTIAVVGDLFEYEGDWLDNAWRAWSKDAAVQQQSRDAVLALADHVIPGHGDRFARPKPSPASDTR